MTASTSDIRFFTPGDNIDVVTRDLPHWMQAGTVCFITWRTWDSIPREWLDRWRSDRRAWLAGHGIDALTEGWRAAFDRLPGDTRREYHRTFSARWETFLDHAHGECVLRRPELRSVVADSLRHFDGDRYVLTDFVVMPNHVHLLAAFPDPARMLAQCESWKHYTAARINRTLGRRGRFWQVDGFDHLVRGPEQFDRFRGYIATNPGRAGLGPDEYAIYSSPDASAVPGANGHSRSE